MKEFYHSSRIKILLFRNTDVIICSDSTLGEEYITDTEDNDNLGSLDGMRKKSALERLLR